MAEIIMAVNGTADIMAGGIVIPQIQRHPPIALPVAPHARSAAQRPTLGGRYCAQCGTALVPSNCVDCNANLAPGTKFCPNCGKAQQT